MSKITIQELKERQGWTLMQKIDHSLGVLDQFISHCGGVDKSYIAFSGGKDSTVLLDMARKVFGKDVKGMFTNTGLEFPDIVKFVRRYENVDTTRPKMSHQQVIEKFGFPLVSKETSRGINDIRYSTEYMKNLRIHGKPRRDGKGVIGKVPDMWQFLAYKIYDISPKCCNELKMKPSRLYEKKTDRFPVVGVMADESALRQKTYLRSNGCNSFEEGNVKSKPLSIWMEKDIWEYINKYKLPISDIYHKGAKRTGCMFCGFGCQFDDDNRFELLKRVEPSAYRHCMKLANNGVSYREALRDVLAVNKLYLPDEEPLNLFNYQNHKTITR